MLSLSQQQYFPNLHFMSHSNTYSIKINKDLLPHNPLERCVNNYVNRLLYTSVFP